MKIVIAPDSYKESLSALEVATAIERGFREIFPEAVYVKLPVADGGEGTVEAMIAAAAFESSLALVGLNARVARVCKKSRATNR